MSSERVKMDWDNPNHLVALAAEESSRAMEATERMAEPDANPSEALAACLRSQAVLMNMVASMIKNTAAAPPRPAPRSPIQLVGGPLR